MKHTRRMTRWFLGGALLALTMAPGVARADDSVHVLLNGNLLQMDVSPVIDEGVTLVPVRAVLSPLGATLAWDGPTQTVTASLGAIELKAVVNSDTALVNGTPVTLAKPVMNRDGRTLIPLRFFAEQLGFQVEWDGESRSVLLSSGDTAAVAERVRTASVSRGESRRTGELVVETAQQLVGFPYAWGGTRPENGFDCSGFIYYLASTTGLELPRTSQEQFDTGITVTQAELAAGDLVFFTTYAEGATHVGVYDGAGGFIHAQSPEVGVVRTSMSSAWWAERYMGARRIFR